MNPIIVDKQDPANNIGYWPGGALRSLVQKVGVHNIRLKIAGMGDQSQ
jgi:hypothetical protein